MPEQTWNVDRRLDVLVLGPMTGNNVLDSSCGKIRQALEGILKEPESIHLLAQRRIAESYVHIPEAFDEGDIVNAVLKRIDIADLIVANLTPRDGTDRTASPNVLYEMGLVHALGLPYVLLAQRGTEIPFYLLNNLVYPVEELTAEALTEVLRTPIRKFLNPRDDTDFTGNRVTQFFDGLPIVDISAAIGLATGYYHNFVGRLLREGSFMKTYPDKVKQVVIVRPRNVLDTYESEKGQMTEILKAEGIGLVTEKLDAPPSDDRGPAWIDHVNGVVVDLPRTIYPLKSSPRLISMQRRLDKPGSRLASLAERDRLLHQTSDRLLTRVEEAILFHVRVNQENIRRQALHFTTMEELPELLRKLKAC